MAFPRRVRLLLAEPRTWHVSCLPGTFQFPMLGGVRDRQLMVITPLRFI